MSSKNAGASSAAEAAQLRARQFLMDEAESTSSAVRYLSDSFRKAHPELDTHEFATLWLMPFTRAQQQKLRKLLLVPSGMAMFSKAPIQRGESASSDEALKEALREVLANAGVAFNAGADKPEEEDSGEVIKEEKTLHMQVASFFSGRRNGKKRKQDSASVAATKGLIAWLSRFGPARLIINLLIGTHRAAVYIVVLAVALGLAALAYLCLAYLIGASTVWSALFFLLLAAACWFAITRFWPSPRHSGEELVFSLLNAIPYFVMVWWIQPAHRLQNAHKLLVIGPEAIGIGMLVGLLNLSTGQWLIRLIWRAVGRKKPLSLTLAIWVAVETPWLLALLIFGVILFNFRPPEDEKFAIYGALLAINLVITGWDWVYRLRSGKERVFRNHREEERRYLERRAARKAEKAAAAQQTEKVTA